MSPDDLPIASRPEDSTKSRRTKPSPTAPAGRPIGAEGEVRGGSEEPEEDPPVEQQKRDAGS